MGPMALPGRVPSPTAGHEAFSEPGRVRLGDGGSSVPGYAEGFAGGVSTGVTGAGLGLTVSESSAGVTGELTMFGVETGR